MKLIQHKGFAALYWVLAFACTVTGGIVGAHLGSGSAPEIGDSTTGATASSHLLFGLLGAITGALAMLAVFAGVWMALWARQRRSHPAVDDRDDFGTLDDLEEDFDEAERHHEAELAEQDEASARIR